MIKDTKTFYNKTKLKEIVDVGKFPPIAYSHAFYKTYPRLPSISLPQTSGNDRKTFKGLNELWSKRKSTRIFSKKGISLQELAVVLRSNGIVDSERSPEKRTYPSGGARFPVETYIISFSVIGLNPGVYHYNIKDDNLELLLEKDFRKKEEKIISSHLKNTAVAFVLTSVISRLEIKYGYKAYPYSFIEAGHMAQNIQLICAQEELGSCCVGGFLDDVVIKALDLIDDEIPLYVIGVGKLK